MEDLNIKVEETEYSPKCTSTCINDFLENKIKIDPFSPEYEHLCNIEVEETNTATSHLIEDLQSQCQIHDSHDLVLPEPTVNPSSWLPEQATNVSCGVESSSQSGGFPSQNQVTAEVYNSGDKLAPVNFVGPANAYYMPPLLQWQQQQSTDSSSPSTDSQSFRSNSSCSQQDLDVVYPAFISTPRFYTKGEPEIGEKENLDMQREQARKALMTQRRKERNKQCSKNFRRNNKIKEQNLRMGKAEKQIELDKLKNQIKKMEGHLRQIKHSACPKATAIATLCLDKENAMPVHIVSSAGQ